jgi:hypothetical protein
LCPRTCRSSPQSASVKTVSGADVTNCHLGSSPRAGPCYRR